MFDLCIAEKLILCYIGRENELYFKYADKEMLRSIVQAAVLDLFASGVIEENNEKRLIVVSDLPFFLEILTPLYKVLKEHSPISMEELLEMYTSRKSKPLADELLIGICNRLEDRSYCKLKDVNKLFGHKPFIIVDMDIAKNILSNLFKGFTGERRVSSDDYMLALVLELAGGLKKVFTSYQREIIERKMYSLEKGYRLLFN